MSKDVPLKIAVISDIHVHETGQGMHVALFQEISQKADLLIICGDLTDHGLPAEAEHLAKDLEQCRIPVIGVLGNHDCDRDQAEEIKRILTAANFHFLDDEPFELRGVGFAGVKGFGGGFDRYILGSFGEPMIKQFVQETLNEVLILENSLRKLETEKIVAVLHYAPIATTVQGEPPEIFPFLGCSRLAESIERFPVKLVIHGHAHHGTYEGKTTSGTPVYNCSMAILRSRNPEHPYAIFEV